METLQQQDLDEFPFFDITKHNYYWSEMEIMVFRPLFIYLCV